MNIKVQNCINGYRHRDYVRVTELAEFYETVLTGEHYADLIREYKSRETEQQKEQRVKITRVRTKAVAGKIEGFFKRPYRVDKIQLKVTHSDEAKKNLLSKHLEDYGQDGETTLSFCEEAALYLNGIDPNALYWVKHTVVDGENEFEPVIFESEKVLDFEVKKGMIAYAVTLLHDSVTFLKGKDTTTKEISIYYLFDKEGIEINVLLDADAMTNQPAFYEAYLNANTLGSENVIRTNNNSTSYMIVNQTKRK